MGVRFKERSEYDWHQATILAGVPELVGVLDKTFPGLELEHGGGWKGYHKSIRARDDAGQQWWMLAHGGPNGNPNLSVTGDHAQEWGHVIRESFPVHWITRVDVAMDRMEPGLFDRILPLVVDRGRDSGAKLLSAGDWHSDQTSRTIYVGSPSSRIQFKMYEKGREVLNKLGPVIPGLGEYISPDWIRCELRIRPDQDHARRMIGYLPVEDLWGFSGVARTIIAQIEGIEVPKQALRSIKVPDTYLRGWRRCMNQWGRTLSGCRKEWGYEQFHRELDRELDRL